jgi:hypothetical protein
VTTLALVLLIVAVVLATLRGLQVSTARVDLGWLAVACVVAAVWMIPALQSA